MPSTKRKTVSVVVTKTIQEPQYNPSTITVTETAEVGKDDDHKEVLDELYESASKRCRKYVKAEVESWAAKKK
jgi:hypothetical protein